MDQVSVCPATADRRPEWHALRPVLILGGLVAIWWALMTGVAHADAARTTPQHHGLDSLRAAAKAHHPTPLREVVRGVHHDVKATTSKVTHPAREQVRPVSTSAAHTVRSTISSTPVVGHTTQTIRAAVSDTAETTKVLLGDTAAGPVVDAVDEAVQEAIEKAESSTGQGNSHSKRPSVKAPGSSLEEQYPAWSSGTETTSSTITDADRAASSSDDQTPADGPFGSPLLPDPCASPSGSGSSSFTPAGVTGSSLLVMPSVVRDLRTWRLARLPGGPAYQPGSSPD